MLKRIAQHWFFIGLLLVFFITMGDDSETVSGLGKWLKNYQGPNIAITLIFFFSGLFLDSKQIHSGITDIKGLAIALILIFLVSPLIAALFSITPLSVEIKIGIFLVAIMPSTLSSGVVMTNAAGGNMAHALFITVVSNSLSVFTIPVALTVLLNTIGESLVVDIDKTKIMIKLFWSVIIPLFIGIGVGFVCKQLIERFRGKIQLLNQIFVLVIIWLGLSQSRQTLLSNSKAAGVVLVVVVLFHGIILGISFLLTHMSKLKPGRRESVIFMGGQKTLPLSVILQVTLFPQYGISLVVCVMHHITHLIIDGYLVGKLKDKNLLF